VVDLRDKELLPGSWSQNNVDNLARLLIPIPSPSNGVVVVGETTILYTNGAGNIQSVAIQQTQVCTYCQIDADGSRYLLGDIRGDLFVLVLLKEGPTGTVCGLAFDYVGSVSIPETLTYLDNGVFFVGSAFGDSQLIKLLPAPNENGSYVQVLDTYLNIGPVIDMCVVESDRQGQCQLVTCSGAFKDGSVRVIRSGIGIHEQASVEIPGIKGLWSVRLSENAPFDKFLVQAFIGESRVLSIDNEEMSEVSVYLYINTYSFVHIHSTVYRRKYIIIISLLLLPNSG
jgi:DNA damage-binding protein 1